MSSSNDYGDDDMAAVGRSLMAAVETATADRDGPLFGWHPAQCPSEVVGDLIGMALESRRLAETEDRPAGDLREVVRDAICKFNGDKTNSGYSMSPIYEEERDCADAILSAIAASGYAAVPREPTEEMVEAAERAAWKHIYIGEDSDEEPVIIGVDKGMRAALRAALTTKEGRP